MEVVLLERVDKLGRIGDVVTVKQGYARNFLLPQQKALRATKDNMAYFEQQKAALAAQDDNRRTDAAKQGEALQGVKAVMIRAASETGQLYGSVTARDVADALAEAGHQAPRNAIQLDQGIKRLGVYPIKVALHPEVVVTVTLAVARSAADAQKAFSDDAKATTSKATENAGSDTAEEEMIL